MCLCEARRGTIMPQGDVDEKAYSRKEICEGRDFGQRLSSQVSASKDQWPKHELPLNRVVDLRGSDAAAQLNEVAGVGGISSRLRPKYRSASLLSYL
jgi:hypothetical protein